MIWRLRRLWQWLSSAVEPDMAYSSYNPLFIYGPSGLGKTHLLHAICNYVNAARPDLSVLFVSSETFTNELIEAIQSGKNKSFREKYRNLDYLLIDDIQFFGGKKSSSTTEIFNTFNTLFDNKKNIILTSDRTPSDIEELEDRLQTRFSSGLLAHISPPDYEICCAILNKRAEKEKINLPDDVVDYIASHINTSIRELEGAYNKLILFSRVRNIPITFEMAREALAEVIPLDNRHRITVPYIIDVVCDYYNVRKDKLLGNGRPKNIVVPRQIAMYLCRKILNESYPNLRDAFKRKDHSTVLYACERVEKDLQRDPSTVKTIELLKNKIERHG
ncbi:MAG: chromosomal replication initiator protein DnaA [Dialister sp.]